MATRTFDESRSDNALNAVFSRSVVLNWELIAYIVIFALALFTRFHMLEARAMSHDESLHTVFSYDLFATGRYVHNPMMHGPILFHMTALSYALFGADDATSRFYPAILGVLMVMFPLLLRRWLGRTGAVLVAVMLLISPMLLYYNRYIRHDTPSILSGMLLFWAALMYISGPQNVRRKAYWLYIIAAAMLWNLGSKETAFIYIAIFGAFLMFYWFARVCQHYFKLDGRMAFYALMMSVLTAGAVTLAMIVVITITLGQYPTLTERADFVVNQFAALFSGGAVTVDFLTFLAWTGLTLVFTLTVLIGTAIWAYRARAVHLTALDVLVGTFSLLLMFVITNAFSHQTTTNDFGEVVRTSTTAASLSLGLIASLSVLLVYSAVRITLRRQFLVHLGYIFVLILAFFLVLIVVEELSHESSRVVSTTEVFDQPDPLNPESAGVVSGVTTFKEYPLVIAWALAAVVIGLMIYTKAKGWWREVKHFPELDVLIVMGSLILPWLTAVFIRMASSEAVDWVRIGGQLAWIQNILPVSSPAQIGQFVIGFLAFLPMALISIAVGLAWNWKRWLIAATVFHVLFAIFFTTVFSNIQGLASGMVYSLQYWMEQQGVRRGSQPQYYYTNIIMPMYEFLPIVGSLLAMVAGWVFFWRKRAERDLQLDGAPLYLSDDDKSKRDDLPHMAGSISYFHDNPATQDTTDDLDAETPVVHITAEDLKEAYNRFDGAPDQPEPDLNREADTIWYASELPAPTKTLWVGFVLGFVATFGFGLMLFNMLLHAGQDVSILGLFTVSSLVAALLGVLIFALGFTGLMVWFMPSATLNLREQALKDNYADPFEAIPQEVGEREGWRLNYVPFLLFVSWWAVFNLFGYTLAGEKMPWLATHLTVPMILLTGWYFGRVIDRIQWTKFVNYGWLLLLLFPLLVVAFLQLILPILGGQPPFNGVSQQDLRWTYSWLAALVVFGGVAAGVYWLASKYTGWPHVRRMFALVVFVGLALFTFRVSWLANYINYDLATEFLVYAHAGPSNKFVVEQLRDLSIRTTGGTDMRIMYDHKFSWPGSWYLRDFRDAGSAIYIGTRVPTQQELESVVAVLVGSDMNPRVQPLLEDAYQQFDYVRMWWPMQDYFNLNAQGVNALMDFSAANENLKRRGLFDIWWSRDYDRYEQARQAETPTGFRPPSYSLTQWPVSDPLFVYIRRDVAAQVWQYGIGDTQVLNLFTEVRPNLCADNYVRLFAETTFADPANPLVRPIGLEVADSLLYVSNDSDAGARINIFTLSGEPVNTFGQPGTAGQDGAFFNRPNGLAIAPDGTIFVVDTWNFRVRVFDPGFDYITGWGRAQTDGFGAAAIPNDGFWGPRDIALDPEGNVFISDTGNKRIRVYAPDGTYRFDVGQGGAGSGDLNEPSGIVIHPDGRLFIADTWNQRIAVFDAATGVFIENYDIRAWREGTGNRPYLALDVERDLLYVTDPDDRRVLVLNTQGDCIGSFGSRAEGGVPDMSQFGDMGGIAVDEAGYVYVADTAYNRVLKFPPFDPATVLEEPEEVNE